MASCPDPRVAILLSTFNGERFLGAQLDSFLAQSHVNWTLYWRDDGSDDATPSLLEAFAARAGQGRCIRVEGSGRRLQSTASFLALLGAVRPSLGARDLVAFADQDDVWLPEKLSRAARALADVADAVPALYCARQILVDADLKPVGFSGGRARRAAFPASLTQNVATGCTLMLNAPATRLIASSTPSASTLHDWWCYLLVTAAGGRVVQDEAAVVLYRQHAGNLVGAPGSMARRAVAALRRGPGVFMNVLRQHVDALAAQEHLLTPAAREDVRTLRAALRGGPLARLGALGTRGLKRQT